ncbi:Glycoside hydrolase family 51 protein [Petrimonas sp. IBARAKI]|jgi:alpha-N-arabinofuranosidase|nr:Glycoside hydrolase family 51 protein [Petrimonas sp. IBARAKI]
MAEQSWEEILTSPNLTDHNTFENPYKVRVILFNDTVKSRDGLNIELPAKSIVTLKIK